MLSFTNDLCSVRSHVKTRPFSVPTSNLVCIVEVAIRTTFSHVINNARIIYYTCSLVIDIQCTRYKNDSSNVFSELCVKTTLLKSNKI